MAGFEPATPCSQSRCAAKLRYIPGFLQTNCDGGGADAVPMRSKEPGDAGLSAG